MLGMATHHCPEKETTSPHSNFQLEIQERSEEHEWRLLKLKTGGIITLLLGFMDSAFWYLSYFSREPVFFLLFHMFCLCTKTPSFSVQSVSKSTDTPLMVNLFGRLILRCEHQTSYSSLCMATQDEDCATLFNATSSGLSNFPLTTI